MSNYNDFGDILTYLAQHGAVGNGPSGDDGVAEQLWNYGRDDGTNVADATLNSNYLSHPDSFGIFDSNPNFTAQGGVYNPFYSTGLRNNEYSLATQLGLTTDDANKAALSVMQDNYKSFGSPYSEASSPYLIQDKINKLLYGQAGQEYSGLTPEQIAQYTQQAKDFQSNIQDKRSSGENAQDLNEVMQIASVFAGPWTMGGGLDAGAAAGAETGAGSTAANAGAGTFNGGVAGSGMSFGAGLGAIGATPTLLGNLFGTAGPSGSVSQGNPPANPNPQQQQQMQQQLQQQQQQKQQPTQDDTPLHNGWTLADVWQQIQGK